MKVWVCPWVIYLLVFVVTSNPSDPEPFIGFHFSSPMVFVKSAHIFCTTSDTLIDLVNLSWYVAATALPQTLENTMDTLPIPKNDTSGRCLNDVLYQEPDNLYRCLTPNIATDLLQYIDIYGQLICPCLRKIHKMRRGSTKKISLYQLSLPNIYIAYSVQQELDISNNLWRDNTTWTTCKILSCWHISAGHLPPMLPPPESRGGTWYIPSI